jgi:hypothetical protein
VLRTWANVLRRRVRYVLSYWNNAVWHNLLLCNSNMFKWDLRHILSFRNNSVWHNLLRFGTNMYERCLYSNNNLRTELLHSWTALLRELPWRARLRSCWLLLLSGDRKCMSSRHHVLRSVDKCNRRN